MDLILMLLTTLGLGRGLVFLSFPRNRQIFLGVVICGVLSVLLGVSFGMRVSLSQLVRLLIQPSFLSTLSLWVIFESLALLFVMGRWMRAGLEKEPQKHSLLLVILSMPLTLMSVLGMVLMSFQWFVGISFWTQGLLLSVLLGVLFWSFPLVFMRAVSSLQSRLDVGMAFQSLLLVLGLVLPVLPQSAVGWSQAFLVDVKEFVLFVGLALGVSACGFLMKRRHTIG